jgi:hypothetical protein
MKKIILAIGTIAFLVLCSCNEDASANKKNKQDASNTSMDEIGPTGEHEAKTKESGEVNLNDGSKDSTATRTQTPGANNR